MPRPDRALFRFALLLLFFAGVPGCASLLKALNGGDFVKPTVTFERAAPRDLALDRVTIDVTFRLDNPNQLEIDLARLTYDLQIEGRSLLTGKPELGAKIPAQGSAELVFPCTIQFTQLANGLQAALAKKIVHWKAAGEAGVNTPIGVVSLPFTAEGDVTLPSMPTIALQPPRVVPAGFTSARVIFPIVVNNPNAFAIPFGGVRGTVTLDGARIGTASNPRGVIAIAANSSQTVEVGLEVSLLTAGAAVSAALAHGSADLDVEGEADVAGFKLPLSVRQPVQLDSK